MGIDRNLAKPIPVWRDRDAHVVDVVQVAEHEGLARVEAARDDVLPTQGRQQALDEREGNNSLPVPPPPHPNSPLTQTVLGLRSLSPTALPPSCSQGPTPSITGADSLAHREQLPHSQGPTPWLGVPWRSRRRVGGTPRA
jgi:hypothetical protein